MDLNEARKKLEASLGETLRKEYFGVLRKWFLFRSTMNKDIFDQTVRKLLVTNDQIRCHNDFLLALLSEAASNSKPRNLRSPYNTGTFETVEFSDYVPPGRSPTIDMSNGYDYKNLKSPYETGTFETVEFSDYVQCSRSPTVDISNGYDYRSAAEELFVPDSGFVSCRISIAAWENNLEGADSQVTELIINVCQTYLKNIITAMVSKLKSYKIHDKRFQHAFNMPVADPFLRNYNNIRNENFEGNVDFETDILIPKCKMSRERAEQGVANEFATATRRKGGNTLSLKLLYETLKNNPKLLGLHSIQSVNLLRLGFLLDDNLPDSSLSESEDEC